MYEYLRGKLISSSPSKVILEVGGIGFKLLIPLSAYGRLPSPGNETLLYVAQVIREDAHTFYGFPTRDERDLFFSFCEVSGIGPKTALALIGHMEINALYAAINQGQLTILCKIPGIGKKTAERLLIEMRDRLHPKEKQVALAAIDPTGQNSLVVDAMNALINLGYNTLQAQKAISAALSSAKPEGDLAALITASLRHL